MQSALQQSVCFRGTVATDDYLLSKNHWIPRVFHRPDDLQLFTPIATGLTAPPFVRAIWSTLQVQLSSDVQPAQMLTEHDAAALIERGPTEALAK